MNRSLVVGLVIGGIVATAGGAAAGYRLLDRGPQFAEVLAVEPVIETIRTPRKVCRDEVVTHRAPTRDPKRVTGAAVGAVVGGVLGHQIGDGRGQTLATVAGAAAGGYAGSKVQKRMQERNTVTTTEKRCATVYDTIERTEGYDVRYTLEGREAAVRMDFDPGPRIPVQGGQLVLTAQPSPRS